MSKYVILTTVKGISPNDAIYMPVHSGQTSCTVLEVNIKHNSVKAIFKDLHDSFDV